MASSSALLLCVAVVLAAGAEARDFVVGGTDDGWKAAPAQPGALARWASANRFHVGDSLVFKLGGAADAVLEVSRDDYNRCSTAAPLAIHKAAAGATATVPLPRSGAYYFVGAAPGSCARGERLLLVVMSQKHARGGHRGVLAPVPAPAPAPTESPLASSLVGVPAAAPGPATGAAHRTADAGTGALLLAAAAVLGAVLVGW